MKQMEKDIGYMDGRFIRSVVLYGALWGACEAVFGFLLHLVSRYIGVPSLAGFFMFPLGLLFMVAGVRSTNRTEAAMMIATLAAAIKVSSSVMGPVPWIFVQNPTVSILFEGLAVWIGARFLLGNSSPVKVLLSAGSVAVSWRILFVLVHLIFGIEWGLLSRGVPAIARFIFFDSAINGMLIFLILRLQLPEKLTVQTKHLLNPAYATSLFVLAVASEIVLSSL
ncbi:MAG: hypothetical protein WD492_02565 [Alkalispirochaeta sp.]